MTLKWEKQSPGRDQREGTEHLAIDACPLLQEYSRNLTEHHGKDCVCLLPALAILYYNEKTNHFTIQMHNHLRSY